MAVLWVSLLFLAPLAPAWLSYLLLRTPFWWLPAVMTAAAGACLASAIEPVQHHSEDYFSAYAEIGNLIQHSAGIALVIYGALIVVACLLARRHRDASPSPQLPRAVVL